MNLLRNITAGTWMIDRATYLAYAPLVLRMMKGEEVTFYDVKEEDLLPSAVSSNNGNTRYRNYNDAPPGSIAVHPIIGMITKFDQYCGPRGTESLMAQMAEADRHPNIGSHILKMDTGGGEATNIETVARFIRGEIKKPVLTWYNGRCCSAGLYIGGSADEFYASEETDIVGSLGVMITFAGFRKYFESQGIDIHEVYADQSKLKNLDFKEALESNYDRLKNKLLNPYAERFIKTMKEFRPQLTAEEAYQGETYMTPKAIDIGMIDGQRTFTEVVDRATQLATIHSQNSNTNMTYERIEAVLGYKLESKDGGVFLRNEELTKIDANLVAADAEAVPKTALDGITASLTNITTKLTAIDTKTTTMETSIAANAANIEKIGSAPGADTTESPKGEEDQPEVTGEVKTTALDEFNKTAIAAAKAGQNVQVSK